MAVLDVKGKLRRKDGKLIILCQIAVLYATFSVCFCWKSNPSKSQKLQWRLKAEGRRRSGL